MDIRNKTPHRGSGTPCALPSQPVASTPQLLPLHGPGSADQEPPIVRLLDMLSKGLVQQNEILASIERNLASIATALNPETPEVVGTRYVADRLGQTTQWVAEMARLGIIPKSCLAEGSGRGKQWKFRRSKIDQWIENR
jgi:Helix-turn-helix domain